MPNNLPKPKNNEIIYQDKKLYICLARFPLAEGHCVVVWKKRARDLSKLSKRNYEYLMDKVDEIRNALIKTLSVKKVYLIYMDESNQVHWHLVPRYNIKGYNLFKHKPSKLSNFSLRDKIRENLHFKI